MDPSSTDRIENLRKTIETPDWIGHADTRTATFSALPARVHSGDVLGTYQIEQLLANGSTASIFAAKHGERRVALKILAAQLAAEPVLRKRFRAEFDLAGRLVRSSIMPVSDYHDTTEYCYYAMPLAKDGSRAYFTLCRESAGGALLRLAADFRDLAIATAALHQAGVVHRDIKPENILMDEVGRLTLTDFGSAIEQKVRDVELDRCPWGTIRYLPPEQLRPDSDATDFRIDVYALGVTLYEAITGTSPFPRLPEDQLARWKINRLPISARRQRSSVPMGLDAIVRRAMEPNPNLRYASATELADDLDRFAARRRGSRR